MKNLLVFNMIFIFFAYSTMIPRIKQKHPHTPLTYKVQVNESPIDIWRKPVQDHLIQIYHFVQQFDKLHIPSYFFAQVQKYAQNDFKYKDMLNQIKAISNLTGISLGKLFFLNFMYQYSTIHACTGILIRNSKGNIIHGRNIDFQMWNMLSQLVVTMQFYNGQQYQYSFEVILGSVFVLTGISNSGFAINENTRKGKSIKQLMIQIFLYQAIPSAWLVRKVIQQQKSFQNAVKRLNQTQISAPIYFIISGTSKYQGVVIERNSKDAHGFYQLNQQTWYLVQTNYDRNIPDNILDYRRTPAQIRLKLIGPQLIDQDLLFKVMQQWPTLNIGTIYTAIMSPYQRVINVTLWYKTEDGFQDKLQKMDLF